MSAFGRASIAVEYQPAASKGSPCGEFAGEQCFTGGEKIALVFSEKEKKIGASFMGRVGCGVIRGSDWKCLCIMRLGDSGGGVRGVMNDR